jgi:hypothetical protein
MDEFAPLALLGAACANDVNFCIAIRVGCVIRGVCHVARNIGAR